MAVLHLEFTPSRVLTSWQKGGVTTRCSHRANARALNRTKARKVVKEELAPRAETGLQSYN